MSGHEGYPCDVCHRTRCSSPKCELTRVRRYIRTQIRAYRERQLPLAWVRQTVRDARAEMVAMRGAA